REHFKAAIGKVRESLGKTYPVYIDGEEVHKDTVITCVNPNHTEEILGYVCEADLKDVDHAIKSAKGSFPVWRAKTPEERAEYLFKAADVARHNSYNLAAWQVLATGKQWDQAHGDVTEAIDFFDYYAHEMLRLGNVQRLGNLPGEVNKLFYEGKGVAAIIAPWNFPLAISAGMVAAALVAGNTIVYKPSELSPIIGSQLADILRSVGLPRGVFNFVPGYGKSIGDAIVDHPDVSLIGFTGSKATGLRIIERAAKVYPGQKGIKKVICEMGGKNAIIVDDDADLDEVVPQVLYSAFGYQGQKCSACSRLIVLDGIYDKLMERLKKALRDKTIGNSEDPSHFMGALIDKNAQEKTLKYQEIARKEGKVLFETPSAQVPKKGYFVPIMVVEGITPECRLAQEEVFGPLLAVMRVKDFNQAIEWANDSEFALTGGVFSRSPENLLKAQKEFRVGNLYLNRGSTGALVGRQAFGGFHMSGGGTKAGGPDYLLNFMDPRLITENTMRRGFTPDMD
ncbi:MAG: L-glutamate gamma-semialdehyde dehydrogenase, partial [Verrucomicrobia bacterium CG_4_9_14_3_um_filter_43_20]